MRFGSSGRWLLLLANSVALAALEANLCARESFVEQTADIGGGIFQGHLELRSLCRAIDVPCGLEIAEGDRFEGDSLSSPLNIVGRASVREHLENIVRRHPRYRWIVTDGVINILPKPGHAHLESGRNPLHRRIRRLDIHSMRSDSAMVRILESASIPDYLILAGPEEIVGPPRRYGTVSLSLRNKTVREALNLLAKEDSHIMWQMEYRSSGTVGGYWHDMHSWRSSVEPSKASGLRH